ncbi:hypothetical protein P0R31_06905 [Bradyrhizobium yuanmingense]|uniref:hypothetical protein n=1 Tax=Bradyrhizobium yuanmingense TaxID=108015 RepID=UPI0023B8B3BC|nr:hypothetical protein [Bradyrhizobium yuanmingense]MDF0516955.1 hypothetical protein [Bradyrhizobium yuanmingense]
MALSSATNRDVDVVRPARQAISRCRENVEPVIMAHTVAGSAECREARLLSASPNAMKPHPRKIRPTTSIAPSDAFVFDISIIIARPLYV